MMNRINSDLVFVVLIMIVVIGVCFSAWGFSAVWNDGEVITITVDDKLHCIENGEHVYKIVSDGTVYKITHPDGFIELDPIYNTMVIGKTYDVRLIGEFPFIQEKSNKIVDIVNASCISER